MKKIALLCSAVFAVFSAFAIEIKAPGFINCKDGVLASWKNTNKTPVKVENGVLTITSVKAKFLDSIYQGHRIIPSDALYVFSVDVDAAVAKSAFVQIKMFAKGKEVLRRDSHAAPIGKSSIYVAASHPQADIIEIAMRIYDRGIGKDFKFSNPELSVAEDGALFGNWLKGGKGFSVSNVSHKSFTINIENAEKNHTSMGIFQYVSSGKKYVFESDFKSDLPGMAYLEVKYYNKGKELKRKQAYCKNVSGRLAVDINTDGCDKLLLQCRVPAAARYVNKKVVFSNFKFKEVK